MSDPIEIVLAALDRRECKPKRAAFGHESRCPAHKDRTPSLSITEGDDGRALIHCHAGCSPEEIVVAIGLEMADLFPSNGNPHDQQPKAIPGPEFVSPVPEGAPRSPAKHPKLGKPSGRWYYYDEEKRPLYSVLRFDTPNGKEIRVLSLWRNPDGSLVWKWKHPSAPRALYRLHELASSLDAPVMVCEGEKTADAAAMLFDDMAVVSSSGGSNAAGKADWSPLCERSIVIWPDNDGPGRKYAKSVARCALDAGAASVSIVQVPEVWPTGWDLADDLPEGVTEDDLRRMVADARQWLDDAKKVSAEPAHKVDPLESLWGLPERVTLSQVKDPLNLFFYAVKGLPPVDAAFARAEAIEILKEKGIKNPAGLVNPGMPKAPKNGQPDDTGSLTLREVLPADGPVDGAELLDELAATFKQYIVLPDHAAETLALWIVFSFCFLAFHIAPILCVSSAEKSSGKTTLLDVIAGLVQRPLMVANASVAAIFRSIEAYRPTLLIDEADSFFQDNEDLRGILNAGHRRGGGVLRTVGDDHEPKSFPVWSPKAVALIGDLPGTLEDRSIVVRLRRASRDEFGTVERFKLGTSEIELAPLAQHVARWSADHIDDLKASDPEMPPSLYGRAADNWRPLLAIADAVGGQWSTIARDAAMALAGRSESESLGVLLLEDLHTLFDRTESGGRQIKQWSSSDLVEELAKMEDRPWPEISRGKPITQAKLAKLLKPYEIQPKNIRFGEKVPKGYERDQFTDAWKRYLKNENTQEVPVPPQQTATPLQRNGDGGFLESQSATHPNVVAVGNERKVNADSGCSGVAVGIPPHGVNADKTPETEAREDKNVEHF